MSTIGRLTGKVVGIVALAGLAALLGLGALVYTQTTEAASGATDTPALEHRGGGRGGAGFCGTAGLDAAAEALGLTTAELQTQLQGGATLSSLADKQGVALQTVLDAVNAACQAETRTQIQQAVTDGTLTQAKADWLLEGLDAGFWGPGSAGGPGFGFGPRGFGGGHGGFGQSPLVPTPTPSTGGSS